MTRGKIFAGLALAAVGALSVTWRMTRDDEIPRRPIDRSTVVVLGDSITEGGDWSHLLPEQEVANRGYSGFTTAQLVAVSQDVARSKPAVVYLLAGTNDIRDGRSPEWSERHLERILDHFRQAAPETTVVVQTVLPRSDAVDEVTRLNDTIVALAASRNLPLLDLHPIFDDGNGGLRPAETTDGIHLTDVGYEKWAEVIRTHVDETNYSPRPGESDRSQAS